MSLITRITTLAATLLAATASVTHAEELASPTPHYESDIAPIFRSHCAGCHNNREWEGEFSLETYANLREGGDKGDPITPGDAEAALLIKVLEGRAKPQMPPKDEPPLPSEDLITLRSWIDHGAPGPREDVSLFSHVEVPRFAASSLPAPITAVAFSTDGTRRATGRYGKVEVSEYPSGRKIWETADLPGKVTSIHFTANHDELLVATGITGLQGVAYLYNLTEDQPPRQFGGHSDILYDAEVSPDNRWLATAGYDSHIRLWDKATGDLARTLSNHQGAVFDVAFHPNSQILASASADETVKLWRVSDGLRLDTLSQPQGEQLSVQFTPDGEHVLSAGADKRLHCWRLVSREEPALNPLLHARFAHEAAITKLLCMPDGQHLISAGADRTLKVWSTPDLVELHAYDPLPDVVADLSAVASTPAFVAARMDGTVQTYGLTVSRNPSEDTPSDRASLGLTTHPHETPEPLTPDPVSEGEPNNVPDEARSLSIPALTEGAISEPGDTDLFRFHAHPDQPLLLAVEAARDGSSLDSKLEILYPDGSPVEQVKLQAVRESWFTFRGKDSDTSDDFRVHNWAEMELNQYLYANGEVVQLWLYPRGPDSGFKVYPGGGKRHTRFFTTALAHPLGEPCYIVEPLPPGSKGVPNGLPLFTLYWENDDDSLRRWGADSQLWFTAPEEGDYLVRLTDVRQFGGDSHHYKLLVRPLQPDFEITVNGRDPAVSPGSGLELHFAIERHEGFSGEVRIDLHDLPSGFSSSSPILIEAGQQGALGVLHALASAQDPDESADRAVKITATALIDGREVTKELGDLGDIQLGPPAKLTVAIAAREASAAPASPDSPLELTIRPGETISARVIARRLDFEGRIELGGDDSGRNLPHGLYVDNIGLNGLLIVEGQTEREFFITAAPWAPPGSRLFHLRAAADGGQTSWPAVIRVLDPTALR